MNLTAIIGSALGVCAIVFGQWLSGGSLGQILQFTAFLVVAGGTAGAVLLAFPWADIARALAAIPSIYREPDSGLRAASEEVFRMAGIVRKEGLLAVEASRGEIRDLLLRRTIKHVTDGLDPQIVREALATEIRLESDRDEAMIRVFEAAGSFSPTIGVIGAVLSLIQALSKLDDPSKIGQGIAAAFVATIYGIGFANLVFLPWAARLRSHSEARRITRELVKSGVVGIQEGLAPNDLHEKLDVYLRASGERARA